jgi:phage tail sheath protein FI
VHKAPANEVVRGISDLELKLSDREQDILNPLNVNVLRDFRDSQRGLRVWGARCLTSDDAWMYVPVRRLFIFLEESLAEGLQWVVFEPNAEPLWAKVRRTITGFLRRVWLDQALAGATEEEAFFVRCDLTTMTEDQIAAGQLVVLVGVAPVRPAEFVIIRIGQKTLEAVS